MFPFHINKKVIQTVPFREAFRVERKLLKRRVSSPLEVLTLHITESRPQSECPLFRQVAQHFQMRKTEGMVPDLKASEHEGNIVD